MATKQKRSTNSRIANSKSATVPRNDRSRVESRLQAQDLINIPLAVFVIFCLYTLIKYVDGLMSVITQPSVIFFMQPTSISLLIAIFGVLFLYQALRRRRIAVVPNVAAGIITLLFVVAFVFVSMFGSEYLHLRLAVALFNPFVGPILSIAAIVGMITLLLPRRLLAK
jgi:hypothetical protein